MRRRAVATSPWGRRKATTLTVKATLETWPSRKKVGPHTDRTSVTLCTHNVVSYGCSYLPYRNLYNSFDNVLIYFYVV